MLRWHFSSLVSFQSRILFGFFALASPKNASNRFFFITQSYKKINYILNMQSRKKDEVTWINAYNISRRKTIQNEEKKK